MTRQLLVVTRLGVRFGDRNLETEAVFRKRLEILGLASERFVRSFDRCAGWVIETDPYWYQTLMGEIAEGRIRGPEQGPVVVSRRGTDHEAEDLAELGLAGEPLLSVRLDSDDVFLPDAVQSALDISCRHGDGVLFDFPHGYLCRPSTGDVRHHSYVMQGPFLGFTTTGPDLSRLHINHGHAKSNSRDVVRIGQRAWVQTVHGSNIVTQLETQTRSSKLRQIRRNWAVNPEQRTIAELPRFLSDVLPVRSLASAAVLNALGAKSHWVEG